MPGLDTGQELGGADGGLGHCFAKWCIIVNMDSGQPHGCFSPLLIFKCIVNIYLFTSRMLGVMLIRYSILVKHVNCRL